MFSRKRSLVCGAGGFIGSFIVETLLQQKAQVRAFIRYNSRGDQGLLRFLEPDLLSTAQIILGDLCDSQAILKALDGVEYVFHLGALISIPYSYIHPDEVVRSNVFGTLTILQACKQAGISRLSGNCV